MLKTPFLTIRFLLVVATALLSGCAVYSPPELGAQAPKPAWINLGVSDDGLILHELDKTSIVRMGSLVDFVDRLTLLDPKNTRHITYRYGYWQIDCANKQFRLKEARLYNKDERLIQQETYNIEQIPFQSIVPNTLSDKQMQTVCRAPGLINHSVDLFCLPHQMFANHKPMPTLRFLLPSTPNAMGSSTNWILKSKTLK